MSTGTRSLGWSSALAALLLASAAQAQETPSVPAFPAQAEVVTVDAVVLDKDGHPLRGLKQSDFVVEADGKPQQIVAFEARDLKAPERPTADGGQPQATEAVSATPGRTLALIVDDLGFDVRGPGVVEAMKKWLLEDSDPRDEVSLFTSSGDVEWTGRVGTGRVELTRALSRIRPQRVPTLSTVVQEEGKTAESVRLSEWEAHEIVSRRRSCRPPVCALAREVAAAWRHRERALVGAIERFSTEHAEERGRKTAIVLTEGFVRDDELKLAEQAANAAQRSNVALYFIDPRGLIAGQGVFPTDRVFEATHNLDLGGALQMADQTGGALVRSNDVRGELTRVADESSAYYLLGYASRGESDGKWHKLRVKVHRSGVTVRARKGYYASREALSAELAEDVISGEQAEPASPTASAPTPASGAAGDRPSPVPTAAQPKTAPAQTAEVPTFSVQAEGVTVDVVVLDKEGNPVTDLAKKDFSIQEDHRAQRIVSFARLGLEPEPGEKPQAEKIEVMGRTLTFLVDDLGITQPNMVGAVKALSRWLSEGADPRDEVTIVTSSGDAWWSDTAGEGGVDLEAVVQRLRGKKDPGTGRGPMSDWEASNIDTLGSPILERRASPAGPPGNGVCTTSGPAHDVLERVVNRWFESKVCVCDPYNIPASIASCRGQAMGRAREVFSAATSRASGLLGAVERVSRGLADSRGRKTIVILSEGFLRDADARAYREAIDASRHGNTSVSFVDVRGLFGQPFFGADQVAPPRAAEIGTLAAQVHQMDTAGGEQLAETTGGSVVRDTNDLEGALTQVANESSFYYLLGYQPDRPLDGNWRRLRVEVARKGVTVHARRGYFATAEKAVAERPVVKKHKKDKKRKKKGEGESLPVRALDPTLSAGGRDDALAVRIAPHVLDMNDKQEVRVLVAIEIDTSRLTFIGEGDQRQATLDVTLLAVSRDQPTVVPLDSRVELGVDAESVGGWLILSREVRLPPGVAQVRVLVRDSASGRAGLALRRVEVPAVGVPYMSTPVFSLLDESGKGKARQVPVARRTFAARGILFCSYEVYPAPGSQLREMPHVMGSFRIVNEMGKTVAGEPASLMGVWLGGLIQRTLAIPLDQVPPGHYELTIDARNPGVGLYLSTSQKFEVVSPASVETASH